MDDQRTGREGDKAPKDPAEGVRIIGLDEAAEAVERGDVASRRSDDELRFGDRPASPPAGPRPALRFPLDASADPTRIERPPVQPAPDPVTGPVELPDWTDPPTGEVPAVLITDDSPFLDDGDDGDAWSSFATSTPRWRDADDDWTDDDFVERLASDSREVRLGALDDTAGDSPYAFDDLEERVGERTGDAGDRTAPPSGHDWSDPMDQTDLGTDDGYQDHDDDGPYDDGGDDGGTDDRRGVAPGYAPHGSGGDRDMGMATIIGVGLAVLAIVCLFVLPAAMVLLTAAALVVASGEYFTILRKVGWESATPIGLATAAALPFAVYWRGPLALALVGAIVVGALLAWFLAGAAGPEPRVLEGAGATLLGIAWIAGLGSTAPAILQFSDGNWLLFAGILATVGYDVAGLFVGRAMGHRPLSSASPNKTVEGLLGGMGAAFLAVVIVVGIMGKGPYHGAGAGILLGLGAALAAPLGDLCQSLIKRDLGVKDMGSLLPGHGGVLDRIDGMLFVIPVLFWLTVAFA